MTNDAERREVSITSTGGLFGQLFCIWMMLCGIMLAVVGLARDYAKVHRAEIAQADREQGR